MAEPCFGIFVRVIEDAGLDFPGAAQRLEPGDPFPGPAVIAHLPGITRQEVREGADLRKIFSPVKELKERFEWTVQFVEAVGKT